MFLCWWWLFLLSSSLVLRWLFSSPSHVWWWRLLSSLSLWRRLSQPCLSLFLSLCRWWPLLPSLSIVVVAFHSLQFKTTPSVEPVQKKWVKGHRKNQERNCHKKEREDQPEKKKGRGEVNHQREPQKIEEKVLALTCRWWWLRPLLWW